MRRFLAILVLSLAATTPATQPAIPQPVPVAIGEVLDVHDGDTVAVRLFLDDETDRRVSLRLKGVMAAELWVPGGKEARAKLATVVPVGSRVTVQRFAVKSDKPWGPRYEKSFDRYVSEVWTADGRYVNGAVK